jgi:peptidoglycan/xylan/chitin deacetylase (PgdA/CDA1 family)
VDRHGRHTATDGWIVSDVPLPRRAARAAKRVALRTLAPIGSVVAVRTQRPEVVFTFDDGPHPTGTPAVLQSLDRHGATATFFVLLTSVRRNPGLVHEIVAAGHEVALHGIDHQRLSRFGRRAVLERTGRGKDELEDVLGAEVRWMRPPYGAQTVGSWRAVRACGLHPVMWGPSLLDSRDASMSERLARSLDGVGPGAIVLAHDAHAGPEDGVDDGPDLSIDRGELVHRVLSAYSDIGLVGRSLGDALLAGRPVKQAWFAR